MEEAANMAVPMATTGGSGVLIVVVVEVVAVDVAVPAMGRRSQSTLSAFDENK